VADENTVTRDAESATEENDHMREITALMDFFRRDDPDPV
jgi:hypothetical protein